MKVRGTWGTSFRAPPFYLSNGQISPIFYFGLAIPDPQSTDPSGRSNVLFLAGNNPDLGPETADVWTAGIDIVPAMLPALSLSFSYFDIDYRDKITFASPQNSILQLESQWAQLITRDPTQEQIDAICNQPGFSGSCLAPIAAIIDARQRNLAVVRVKGLDADLGYSFDTSYGRFGAALGGTYTFGYEQQVSKTSPAVDVVDTVGNPLQLRLRGNLSWSLRDWTVSAYVNHAGSYEDPASNPRRKVDSLTTLDLGVGYGITEGHGWLDGTRLTLSAVNVFDEAPPFVNTIQGYDALNGNLLGRTFSAQLTKRW